MLLKSYPCWKNEEVEKGWIGHVLRHDSLLKKVIEGRLQGKKIPGAMLLDSVMQEYEENEINYAKLKEKAQAREAWQFDITEKRPSLGQNT